MLLPVSISWFPSYLPRLSFSNCSTTESFGIKSITNTSDNVEWGVCSKLKCICLVIIITTNKLPYFNNTHTRLTALWLGLPGWAGTRKVQLIWILQKQETVSGNGISRAICKSAPCSRQITMPASHHSVFYRPDALSAAKPTASMHWRQ